MKYDEYELKDVNCCTRNREYPVQGDRPVPPYAKRAKVVYEALDGLINGTLTEKTIYYFLASGFLKAGFMVRRDFDVSKFSKDLQRAGDRERFTAETVKDQSTSLKIAVRDSAFQLIRLYTSLRDSGILGRAPLRKLASDWVKIGDHEVNMHPSYMQVVPEEKTIYIFRVVDSKPAITQKDADEGAGDARSLYGHIKYAEKFVPSDEAWLIKAFLFYLRRDDDKTTIDKDGDKARGNQTDFFEKGGRNVISVSEIYKKDGCSSPLDVEFHHAIEEFNKGKDPSTCTKKQCEKCGKYAQCLFVEPFLKVVEKLFGPEAMIDVSLSLAQEEIVELVEGAHCVIAKAGSGKTFTMVFMVMVMLMKGIRPEKILMVTHTVKAAQEMRTRIDRFAAEMLTGPEYADVDVNDIHILTFNALGDMVLKDPGNYKLLGYDDVPVMMDPVYRGQIIKDEILDRQYIQGLDYRNMDMDTEYVHGALPVLSKAFDIIKRDGLVLGDEEKLVNSLRSAFKGNSYTILESTAGEIIKAYDIYDDILHQKNLMEFADQEQAIFQVTRANPYFFEKMGFSHVIVDEAQDCSSTQVEILKILRNSINSEFICLVGDPSQNIYVWRGAMPGLLENIGDIFNEEFTYHELPANYRSSEEICEFCNYIDKEAGGTVPMKSHSGPNGIPVEVLGFYSKEQEIAWICEDIKKRVDAGTEKRDIAYLDRKRVPLGKIGDALAGLGIPATSEANLKYLDNPRVLAFVDLCKWVRDRNATMCLATFVNALTGGKLIKGLIPAKEAEELMSEVIESMDDYEAAEGRKKVDEFIKIAEAINYNDDPGYAKFLEKMKAHKTMDDLLDYMDNYERFGGDDTYKDEEAHDSIRLNTAHGCKGMEYPIVYVSLTGFEDKSLKEGDERYKETLRLMYVACSRAKQRLIVTGVYAAYGRAGEKSYNRFLELAHKAVGKEFDKNTLDLYYAPKPAKSKSRSKKKK